MDTKSVTKYNGLIEASYRLSLNEARIVFYGISLINPLAKEFPLEFKVDLKHFAEMFGIDNRNVYSMVKQAAMDKFWEREFTFAAENNTEDGKRLRVRWINGIEYGDKEGYIKIFINPLLKPFLHQLSGNFTKYYLEYISQFRSIYSVRFYEIALMNLKRAKLEKCIFSLEIKEIRDRLELADKYKRFCDFKPRILEPAKKEINKHSDIKFNYKVIKSGRSPQKIEFIISRKLKDQPVPPTLSEYKPPQLSPATFEKAKQIVLEAGNRWDIYAIKEQFYEYIEKKGQPESLKAAFLGFVKKKVAQTALNRINASMGVLERASEMIETSHRH